MKKYEYLEIDYTAKGVVFLCTDKHKKVINSYAENGYRYVGFIPTEIDAKGSPAFSIRNKHAIKCITDIKIPAANEIIPTLCISKR